MADLPLIHGQTVLGVKTPALCNIAGEIGIANMSNTYDAFQRLRTGNPHTVLSLKQLYDNLPLFYDDQEVSGAGTGSVFNTNRASSTISVSNATAGKRVRQSKTRGTYQPAKSFDVFLTATIGATGTGITKALGYFDDNNGLFFQVDSTGISVVIRSFITGAAVDTVIPQASWNGDKLDGTGESGFTLDITSSNIYFIDLAWLGVGRVRFGLNIDGEIIIAHSFLNSNSQGGVYMSDPNLPIRFEIDNDGTGAADSMETICTTLISNGGEAHTSATYYVSRNGASFTLPNQDLYAPLVSIRINAARGSARLNVNEATLFMSTNSNYEWRLVLNPAIAGVDAASWVTLTNTSVQYDISRDITNLVTGGTILAGGYGASSAQNRASINEIVRSFLTIGTNIDGSSDEIVLCMANIDANGGTAYGGLSITEFM